MPDFRLSLMAALTLALMAGPLAAQDAPAADAPAADAPAADAPAGDTPAAAGPATGTGFNPGTEVAGEGDVGQDYVLDTKGDWEIRCIRTENGFDPCRMYQLLQDGDGNNVAEFALVALPSGSQAIAGATIITPLETLLTAQLTLVVDGGKAKRYPFTWCSQIGCFSRIGFTEAELAGLKKGNAAKVTIVPMLAPDQKVELTVSLSGFTAGYEAMKTVNEETQKRAAAAKAAAEGGN